jgi:signal transduction histidine kinase
MYSASSSDQRLQEKLTTTIIKESKEQKQQQESPIAETKKSSEEEGGDEQLKVRSVMQMEFINIAAHELRTPIQPIVGLSEILISMINDTQQLQLLNAIVRNARRLQQLTNDILDVTQIESHSLNVMKELFNLSDIIVNVVEDMLTTSNHLYNNKKIVKLLYEPKDIFVNVDKDRITQVISNLLNNAIKFTQEGSISIEVEEKVDERKDGEVKHLVVIRVKDTGIGLDPEILPKLFSKFATKSHHSHTGVGVGLGLFISKNIVEAHGGKIWAENNVNEKGATFHVILPA